MQLILLPPQLPPLLALVLQMSFPQRLQHGTPGILKKKTRGYSPVKPFT